MMGLEVDSNKISQCLKEINRYLIFLNLTITVNTSHKNISNLIVI